MNILQAFFYICSSVHRNSKLKKSNKMQLYADIYLLLNYSTCFGRPLRPSSGVHNTVVAASGTDHTIWRVSFLKRDQISPYLVVTKKEASATRNILLCIQCLACELYAWTAVTALWFGKATFLLGWPNLHQRVAHKHRWITECRRES